MTRTRPGWLLALLIAEVVVALLVSAFLGLLVFGFAYGMTTAQAAGLAGLAAVPLLVTAAMAALAWWLTPKIGPVPAALLSILPVIVILVLVAGTMGVAW